MKTDNKLFHLLFIVVSVYSGSVSAAEPWKELFDGKTLGGWVQKGGRAVYAVENGQIVGKAVLNTPNSFLCTKQFYSDCIVWQNFCPDRATVWSLDCGW